MVAMFLAAMLVLRAGPAVAQEEPQGPSAQYEQTEVVEQTESFEGYGIVEYLDEKADGTPVYGLSVAAEMGYYREGDFAFSQFDGQRVYATGQIVYGQDGRFLRVESIEAAGTSEQGRTVTFELTTEGTVPEGVYTGELAFPAENYPAGNPIPLSIGGLRDADYPNGYTIRDFGPTLVEDGQTLSATYAFGAGQGEENAEPTTASASAGATAVGAPSEPVNNGGAASSRRAAPWAFSPTPAARQSWSSWPAAPSTSGGPTWLPANQARCPRKI